MNWLRFEGCAVKVNVATTQQSQISEWVFAAGVGIDAWTSKCHLVSVCGYLSFYHTKQCGDILIGDSQPGRYIQVGYKIRYFQQIARYISQTIQNRYIAVEGY